MVHIHLINYLVITIDDESDVEKGVTYNKLAQAYKESSQFSEIGSELSSILDQAVKSHKQYAQFSTSFPWQVFIYATCQCDNFFHSF